MSALLARQLGLPDSQVSLIARGAPLHDVGKIGVPDTILLKMGKLTAEEFEVVKTHTAIGARILSGGKFPLLRLAEEIAFTHHERWTHGYAGIRGTDIALADDRRGCGVLRRATQQLPTTPPGRRDRWASIASAEQFDPTSWTRSALSSTTLPTSPGKRLLISSWSMSKTTVHRECCGSARTLRGARLVSVDRRVARRSSRAVPGPSPANASASSPCPAIA